MNYDNRLLSSYKSYEIAKYIRLSLADGDGEKQKLTDESESVVNQRKILNEFIDRNGNVGADCMEFIDDGCSGTNFDRPGWNKLQEQMECGKIRVLITKNLSRLGRSNSLCSYFLDYYFPENNIRYIAIGEQIDTGNGENTNNEYAALNNFINEKYSRDLSNNIKRVYKIKQQSGEYMGGIPVYGYKKDSNDKHKLVIDEEAAKVVRCIFDKYLELQSQSAVMRYLSENNVLIPEVYKGTKRGIRVKYPCEWNYHTIRDILRNQMYIGNMVQNVHSKKNFREKKIIKNDKKDWIVVENTHEAIVDKTTFNKVQDLLNVNYRQPSFRETRIFKGLMFCHECGHLIGIGSPKNDDRYLYTYCNYYKRNSRYNKCSSHTMNYGDLEKQILKIVENICSKYIRLVKYDFLVEKKKNTLVLNSDKFIKRVEELEIDKKRLDLKKEKLYIDRLNDVITLDTYVKLAEKFEEQRKDIQTEINRLGKNIKNENGGKNRELLITEKVVDKYLNIRKELSRELILKMINRVEIHQDKNVDLYFNFKV